MGQHQSVILEQVHDAYVAQERDFNDQDDKAHHQDENVSGSQRTTKKFDDIEKKERGWMLTKQRGNGTAKPLLPPTSLKAKARRRNDATPESKSLHGQVQALLAAQAAERAAKDQADKMQRRTEDLVDRVKNFISWDEESGLLSQFQQDVRQKQMLTPRASDMAVRSRRQTAQVRVLAELSDVKKGSSASACNGRPLDEATLGLTVEKSLGSKLDTFAGYQGSVHYLIETGKLDEGLLRRLFEGAAGVNNERAKRMSNQEKWEQIKLATEQLLSVYTNKSNCAWIEKQVWERPQVWDGKPAEASEYATAMEAHLANGSIAAMFIDDGREVQVNDSVAPLVSADVWRAVKELCPNRLATGCRIEQLSIAGRHLLAAAVSIESKHGPAAVKRLKVVVAVDEEQEPMLVAQLRQWQFFGLHPANVAILPLQRYHGFAQNWQTERLQPTKASDRRLLGSGYALHLLSSPAEAYTLDADCSEPEVIRGSLLQWLEKHHVRHLLAGLFSDVERLRPDAMFDMTFLSGAQFSEERLGTNMAVEVITAPSETVMRAHDSVVLQRAGHVNRACDLRPSTLRTVNAHQLLAPLTSKGATIYVSTRRYLFTLPFLKAHAPNVSNFHADLRLQDFQAYASFDLSDVTTWDGAHCAAVSGSNLPGPLGKADTVYDKTWLSKAAAALEAQDAAPEFRKKAIAVLRAERAPTINPAGVSTASTSGMTTTASSAWGSRRTSIADSRRSTGAGAGANPFGAASAATLGAAGSALRTLQRSQGINVVLLLGPEHQAVAKMALKVAKRFLPNIVDKLHIVMVANYGESTLRIEQMLKELYDKELDFNEQIVRDTILRHEDTKTSDLLKAYCEDVGAAMVVVGSDTLTSTATATAGANVNSLAMLAARHVTNIPVLVVKSNASGTFVARTASDSAATDRCTAMVHLDAGNVAPVVSFVSSHLVSGQDRIILARPSAYERHGPMTMCTRRMFVQGRMAVKQGVEIVEQAFAGVASAELPAACAASSVDLLVVSVSGELPISKTIEELLKTVDSSVLIYRTPVEEGDMLSTIKI